MSSAAYYTLLITTYANIYIYMKNGKNITLESRISQMLAKIIELLAKCFTERRTANAHHQCNSVTRIKLLEETI